MRNLFWSLGAIPVLVTSLAGSAAEPTENSEAAAWRAFCAALAEAGAQVLETYPQPTHVDRAEGLRYLTQQLSSSIEQELIRQEGEIPLLRIGSNSIQKWGIDSADAKTQFASVDPTGTYRLSGTRGSARLVAVQMMTLQPEFRAFASLSEAELQPDADGQIDVMVSKQRPPNWSGAWLEMHADSSQLLIREYFADWAADEPGTFRIERVDGLPERAALTPAESVALLERMAARFASRPARWLPLIDPLRTQLVNRVAVRPAGEQGLADNLYGGGWFRLAEGEALIIEIEAPDARLWSIQLANVWSEAFDAFHRTGGINSEQAVASSDGVYRFVIADSDPGVPNWLDTAGHAEGLIEVRYQQSKNSPQPKSTLTSLANLRAQLPMDTPSISPAERAADSARRRAHAARRWAP